MRQKILWRGGLMMQKILREGGLMVQRVLWHRGLRHHANRVLERLALVAEPDPDHFTLVPELISHRRDFSTY